MSYRDYDPSLVWGAMIDLDRPDAWIRSTVSTLGLTVARVSAHWDLTEPEMGGSYDWTITDDNIKSAIRWGLEPVVLIIGTPTWVSEISETDVRFLVERGIGNFKGIVQPKQRYLGRYTRWVRSLARRYKGRVHYYEYWNEPDGMGWPIIIRDRSGRPVDVQWGGNVTAYAVFLEATYLAIKKVDPSAQVAVGGLESKTEFLESLYRMGKGRYFDAVCIHPYGGGEEMGHGPPGEALNYDWIDDIRRTMDSFGDREKPIWVTEYGWKASTSNASQVECKSRYLSESLAYFARTPWITIAILHYLSGDANDPWDCTWPSFVDAWREVRWAA